MSHLLTKRSLSRLLAALCALCLAGCVTPPTEQELKTAHYGRYPGNHRSAVNELLNNRHDQLGEPFKVVSVSKPQKDWMGDSGNRTWGYSSEVAYQAPNPAVGAPIYLHREKLFFRNGRLVHVSNAGTLGDSMVSALASNVAVAQQQPQAAAGGANGGDADASGGEQAEEQTDDSDAAATTTRSGRRQRGSSGGTGGGGVSAARRTAGGPRAAARSPLPVTGKAPAKAKGVKAKAKKK